MFFFAVFSEAQNSKETGNSIELQSVAEQPRVSAEARTQAGGCSSPFDAGLVYVGHHSAEYGSVASGSLCNVLGSRSTGPAYGGHGSVRR